MAKLVDTDGLSEFKYKLLQLVGTENGIAGLDSTGKIPSSQLPSYVDDILEYSSESAFPAEGETGKIYVDKATGKIYRWSGSIYVEISESLALGETSSTAYRGDYGAAAYAAAVTNKTSSISENNANLVTSGAVYSVLSSKSDKVNTANNVAYDTSNKKITKTINGVVSDVVSVSTIKSDLGAFTWGMLAGK